MNSLMLLQAWRRRLAEDIVPPSQTDQTEFNVFNTDASFPRSYPYRNSCAKFRARNPSFISRAGSRRPARRIWSQWMPL